MEGKEVRFNLLLIFSVDRGCRRLLFVCPFALLLRLLAIEMILAVVDRVVATLMMMLL
jgi:hypothetical protein